MIDFLEYYVKVVMGREECPLAMQSEWKTNELYLHNILLALQYFM